MLIWRFRFRAERRHPAPSGTHETRAIVVAAIALAVVSAVLGIQPTAALASGSHPGIGLQGEAPSAALERRPAYSRSLPSR